MGSPANSIFSIFALVGFVISLVPLSWHLQAWNIGTCAFMLWTAFACLNFFINSILWDGRFDNFAPIWCDISSHYIMALAVAIPACSLCINRRLYYISTQVTMSRNRRREIAVDLAICLGIPIAQMIVAYIPQGNRFNIYEEFGCYPAVFDTWVAVVLYNIPAIVVGLISAVYCIMSICAFRARKQEFDSILASTASPALNPHRFFRLMAIAATDIIFTVPLSLYVTYINCRTLHPWISWEETHFNFGNVFVIPVTVWRSPDGGGIQVNEYLMEFNRWSAPFSAIVFFALFGLTEEARKRYVAVWVWLKIKAQGASARKGMIRMRSDPNMRDFDNGPSLPSYNQHRVKSHHISFDTISISDSYIDESRPISQVSMNAPPSQPSVVVTLPEPTSRFSTTTSMALDLK